MTTCIVLNLFISPCLRLQIIQGFKQLHTFKESLFHKTIRNSCIVEIVKDILQFEYIQM